MSDMEKLNLCYKMCVASLIGEKMFNFAELIEKDFFKVLSNSQYEWISYLILSFNSAKVDQFLSMFEKFKISIVNDKVLSASQELLEVKIRIAALLDLIFHKNKNERVLTYKEITDNCHCDVDQIEFIVIKALSLGLIKGYIDGVENKVVVNWVQPKYLDREKIVILHDRLDHWMTKANRVLSNFQETSSPLLI
jgi:26S proteasome regulatory subunit N9